MKTGKKIMAALAGTIILLLIILDQSGFFATGQIEPGNIRKTADKIPADAEIFEIKEENVPVIYSTVGTVRSRDEIEISPRITARVTERRFRSGDSVKKGDVLIKLDDKDLAAAVERSRQNLNAAEAVLKNAESEFKRSSELYEKKVIPIKNMEESEKLLKMAQASFEAAIQALTEAKANLSFAEIISPIDAIVAETYTEPGDMAAPSKILMRIYSPDRLMLYAPVRESLVGLIKIGAQLNMMVDAVKKKITGEVREIVPSVDQNSRTLIVKICIGKEDDIMPGMSGTLDIVTGEEKAIFVPEKAVIRIGQLEYLNKVLEDGSTRMTLVRTVRPHSDPERRRVISGAKPGDRILVGKPHDQ